MRFKDIFLLIMTLDILLDVGKWAAGRYWTCNALVSCSLVVVGSLILAVVIRRKLDKNKKRE